ncbi:MAG: conjugative transposon protein TraN [Porphyromonas somerae]|uniref:conjugative transposon protein TraN n=1 Tax=Porphyromonas TaxID=836 RepID=UPI001B8D0B74|nr:MULTISPECIES: conjugative transposon protein TraN [Porphyromonas]MDD7557436.1 conjugative transposon protein TraN [Porphyromonas somerae]MDY3884134.1 conjugative transposon protein TraN [Porphyromonas somerae]MDY5815297.1 conjugative transposon protein TraN [Porphyromonas somerae]
MRRSISLLVVLFVSFFTAHQTFAQVQAQEAGTNKEDLPVIFVNKDVSTHFVSPERIDYVDISIADIAGDLPLSNTLRVKPTKEGASGVLTITSERFMVQYLLMYTEDLSKVYSRYNIPYSDVKSYLNSESDMTQSQLHEYCYNMLLSKNNFFNVSSSKYGMRIRLNNIYSIDKYFFLDLSLFNQTNIQYDIENIRFMVEDKKKTKATTFQSIEISPILVSQQDKSFKKKYRNVFVFEKFTFPEEKVFVIELSEKQLSGRVVRLEVEYSDILNADQF